MKGKTSYITKPKAVFTLPTVYDVMFHKLVMTMVKYCIEALCKPSKQKEPVGRTEVSTVDQTEVIQC